MCFARLLTHLVGSNQKSQSGHNAVSPGRNTSRLHRVRSTSNLEELPEYCLTRAEGFRPAHGRSSTTVGRSSERLAGARPNVVEDSRRRGAGRQHFTSLRASSSSTSASSVTLAKSATFRRRNLHLVRRPIFVTSWLTRVQCATSNAPLCRFGPFDTSLLDARRADGETESKASRARREPVKTRGFALSPIGWDSFPTGSIGIQWPTPNPAGREAGLGMTRAWVARGGGGLALLWACPSETCIVSWWPSASCVGQRTSGRVRFESDRAALLLAAPT